MADLDPELASLRDAAAGVTPMVELEPAVVRDRIVAGNRLCSAGPETPVRSFSADEDGAPVPLRIYEPSGATSTLVYAHGGGWVTGGLDYADEFCRFLAQTAGLRVVNVDYRLAPEHPYPSALEDFSRAWEWAHERWSGPMAVAGDSAGGNLAASLSQRLRGSEAAPTFQVLLYPVLGPVDATASYRTNAAAFPTGAAEMRWFFDHYAGPGSDSMELPDPDLFPLQATDVSGLPPTHVVVVGHDPLHDEGMAYVDRLASSGVPVDYVRHPTLCHGFLRFTGASQAARSARDEACRAVARLAASVTDCFSPTNP